MDKQRLGIRGDRSPMPRSSSCRAGNQQKVVIAKAAVQEPKYHHFRRANPRRGRGGYRRDSPLHQRDLADRGIAVVVISSLSCRRSWLCPIVFWWQAPGSGCRGDGCCVTATEEPNHVSRPCIEPRTRIRQSWCIDGKGTDMVDKTAEAGAWRCTGDRVRRRD